MAELEEKGFLNLSLLCYQYNFKFLPKYVTNAAKVKFINYT